MALQTALGIPARLDSTWAHVEGPSLAPGFTIEEVPPGHNEHCAATVSMTKKERMILKRTFMLTELIVFVLHFW